MNRNILIGIIVVVVLVAGGWWYMNKSSVPATSETTQLPTLQETTNAQTQTVTKPSVPAAQTQPSNQPVSSPADNEISYTAPIGYHIRESWYGSQDEVYGIDKQIGFIRDTYWQESYVNSSGGKGAPAQISISFYRNPQNLTVQQWLEMKEITYGGKIPTGNFQGVTYGEPIVTYNFKDRTGVRFTYMPEMHYSDSVVVQHKNWIVYFHNGHDGPTDSQNQVFEQLLTSITFAK